MEKVKLVVFVPLSHAKKVREAIGKSGAGVIGNYEYCSFSNKGIGRFKPNEKSKPYIRKANRLETVKEERIEFVCPKSKAKSIIKKAHPYEEVALDIYLRLNEDDL